MTQPKPPNIHERNGLCLPEKKERVTHVYGDIAYYCLHSAGRYQRSGHAARTLQKVQDERSDVTETGYERK